MKKLLLVIFIMLLIFTGCVSNDTGSANNLKGLKIALLARDFNWWDHRALQSIQTTASQRGVSLVETIYTIPPTSQFPDVDSVIAQKVDAIVLNVFDRSIWKNELTKVKNAGIPVFIYPVPLQIDDNSLFVTCVGNDGQIQGEKAADWLVSNKNVLGIDPLQIYELEGDPTYTEAVDRKAGFDKVFQNGEIAQHSVAYWDYTQAHNQVKNVLDAGLPFNVIYAHNDSMGLGAKQAIEESSKVPGKDIIIVSIDASDDAIRAIKEGKYNCTIETSANLGPLIFDAISKFKKGEPVEKWIKPDNQVFDK